MFVFEQCSGRLFWNRTLLTTGYAGGNVPPNHNPAAVNNPDLEFVPCVGPLPQGMYQIGTAVERTRLGSCAMPLFPDAKNNMRGRDGFFIHADSLSHPGQSSEGCIVVIYPVRLQISRGTDRVLKVVARMEDLQPPA